MSGQSVIYKGGCDFIKTVDGEQQWDRFQEGELIVGQSYKTLGNAFSAPGCSLLKQNKELNIEDSWKYYDFCSVLNEYGQKIYVWQGFFIEYIK